MTAARSSASTGSPLFVVRIASRFSGDRSSNGLHPVVRQEVMLLSIYRPLCRGRAVYLCIVPAKSERNDSNRALSHSVVGYRIF